MTTAQNPNALLGKMLRIDVDKRPPARSTAFRRAIRSRRAAAPEVYILGMRNPWRWSFDRGTGDLWVGDVGQGEMEELTMVPAGTKGRLNFGWSKYKGNSCYDRPCDAGRQDDAAVRRDARRWLVLGDRWQVYRGSCYPDMVGTYYFTDYCRAQLMTAKRSGTNLDVTQLATSYLNANGMHAGPPPTPSSLHADSRGELFLTTTTTPSSGGRGGVWHLEAAPCLQMPERGSCHARSGEAARPTRRSRSWSIAPRRTSRRRNEREIRDEVDRDDEHDEHRVPARADAPSAGSG